MLPVRRNTNFLIQEAMGTMRSTTVLAPAYDLTALRRSFEVVGKGYTYLNHAGMSPLAIPVKEAMRRLLEDMASRGSVAFTEAWNALEGGLEQRVAQLVNARPHEVVPVQSTSVGINTIAQSLPLRAGDNVLLCDVEFPSNVYPWMNLAHKGVEVRLVPAQEGGLTLEALDAARDARSRVVAVSAVQFFTGRREDLAALGRYCADHHLWLVVDAIQAAGVVPLDMRAMGIHALVAGGQKALCGPPGQGFMVIREELIDHMVPITAGPLSVQGWEHWLHYDMTPRPGAGRFAMGTISLIDLVGLMAALDLLMGLGVEHIARWVTHLSDVAIADLQKRGYAVLTPAEPQYHAHIVTFAWEGDIQQALEALQAERIVVASHLDAAGKPHIRISAHCYNTEEEVLRVASVLEHVRGR